MENKYKKNKEAIKSLWDKMLPDTRRGALNAILNEDEFNVTDVIYLKQTWVWGGRTPQKHQAKVIEIFNYALETQSDNARAVLEQTKTS